MLSKIILIYKWLAAHNLTRFTAGAGLGVIIWTFSSNTLQDIIVFSAFVYALFFAERGKAAWRQPAGIAFVVLLFHHLASLPFSVSPEISVHDTGRLFEVLAGAFAVPVVFNTDRKIARALFYSAAAIALTLGWDLIRMSYYLGPDIFAKAHSFQPFILNHSNVASMMAGLAFFVFLSFAWRWRGDFRPALGCLAGSAVCLAYLIIATSRGPQIAFAIAFASIGVILPGRQSRLVWFICLFSAGVLLFLNYDRVNPRFAEKSTMTGFSERDKVWKHTWDLAGNKKWFGHGYGKRNFEMHYYASSPRPAKYHFPHCHQYWLKLLFEYGRVGVGLYAAAWLILAVSLLRKTFMASTLDERLLPGTIALMLLFIHLYGLGDYPDNIVQTAQIWLVPAALVALAGRSATGRDKYYRAKTRRHLPTGIKMAPCGAALSG
ncbi:MAG: O-antigen ligase family protein [Kiritimatiellae bacterium]|nr:O-antigen ligase family protein [Kiritimatiellia bacterium]